MSINRILLLSLAFLLTSCGPKPILRNYLFPLEAIPTGPDSLKASLDFSFLDPSGERHSLSASAFCVPQKKYRVEMRATLGISIASLLWMNDSSTTLILREELFKRGTGDWVNLQGVGIPPLNIHRVFAPLWGEILPSGWRNAERQGPVDSLYQLKWHSPDVDADVMATMHQRTGEIKQLSWSEELIEFNDYERFDELVLPTEIKLFRNKKEIMTMTISSLDKNPDWSDRLWSIRIPDGFREF